MNVNETKLRKIFNELDMRTYQKEFNNKVKNVKYLGNTNINVQEKEIYLVLEQFEKNGELIEIEKYYTEDLELLAGNNKSDEYDYIILNEKFLDENQSEIEREELLEFLENVDKEGILDLSKIEDEKLEKIAKALGRKKEDIAKLSEIDLEDEEEKNKEKDDDELDINQDELEKVNVKSEIEIDERITDNKTMEQMLGVEDKGYKKIAIVYTDAIPNNPETTRFSMVGIKIDGTVEKIDSVEKRFGNNPNKELNVLSEDGEELEQKNANSIYQLEGNEEAQIALGIGEYGYIDVSYIRTHKYDNNENIGIPIETQNIRPTTREAQELMNENRNHEIREESIKAKEEIQKEQKQKIDDDAIKKIDDNNNQEISSTFTVDQEYVRMLAEEIKNENEELLEIYNTRDIENNLEEVIKKEIKKNGTFDRDRVKKIVSNNMGKEAKAEKLPGQDNRN